jgi:hypothetical protein
MLEPPWGFETPDYALRVASRTSTDGLVCRGGVRRRVAQSVCDRSVGCSIGCSGSQRRWSPPGRISTSRWMEVHVLLWLLSAVERPLAFVHMVHATGGSTPPDVDAITMRLCEHHQRFDALLGGQGPKVAEGPSRERS